MICQSEQEARKVAQELANKYGRPHQVYKGRLGIWHCVPLAGPTVKALPGDVFWPVDEEDK